jgi:hypothetical protein
MFRRTNHLQITCLLSFASGIALSHSAPADEIHVPDDYPKISTAISEADDGDVIIVHPGDYPEHINFLGKPITVRSTDPTDPYVVMNTRIIGYYESDLVTCENDEGPDTVLAGFTITHENPDDRAVLHLQRNLSKPRRRHAQLLQQSEREPLRVLSVLRHFWRGRDVQRLLLPDRH